MFEWFPAYLDCGVFAGQRADRAEADGTEGDEETRGGKLGEGGGPYPGGPSQLHCRRLSGGFLHLNSVVDV